MRPTDPHIFEIIEFLQPFIDGKIYKLCDLERSADGLRYTGRPESESRHSGHSFCHDNPTPCACPCHWTQDEIAYKLIGILTTSAYPESGGVIGTWLGSYMGRQMAEAKRLRSLADGRDAMVKRVTEALTGP